MRSHVGQVLKPNDYPIRHTGSRPSSVNLSILFCRGHVVFRHFFAVFLNAMLYKLALHSGHIFVNVTKYIPYLSDY